jgi:hypothetical protein
MPGMPSTFSQVGRGARRRVDLHHGALVVGRAGPVALHAEARPLTWSPAAKRGDFDSDHHADAAGAHHFADRHRADIRLPLVHPAAHGRVERHVEHLTRTSPSASGARASSAAASWLSVGMPTGREARRNCWLVACGHGWLRGVGGSANYTGKSTVVRFYAPACRFAAF